MLKQLFQRSRTIMLYASLMAAMVFVLKWLQWKYLIADHSIELYIGLVAIFFTGLGAWLASHLSTIKVHQVVVEKQIHLPPLPQVNEAELKKLNLTNREYDVLKLLKEGLSNADIAEKLFLSLSTVKTHVSSLFVKMDVKSRTQAIEKANRLE
jgi:DNA-binding CsgD family transcriptional regulator